MIPKYPDGLPCILRDGYGFDKINKIRSTDMDVGRAVHRWEFDDAPSFASVSWIMTEPQSRLFNAWNNQVVKAGWFTITLLSDMGFEDVTARFVETPKRVELIGQFSWKWSATLEVEFEPMLAEGWAEILPDYILDADIFDRAINEQWPYSPYAAERDANVFDYAINEQWP